MEPPPPPSSPFAPSEGLFSLCYIDGNLQKTFHFRLYQCS